LVPTPKLKTALREAHPHFIQDKYLGFVVITQSCDLVRRKGAMPSAPYVAIAAVRSLSAVLPKLLSTACDPWNSGIFPESRRESAKRLLERVFNQNEQGLGVFYLHPDHDVEIAEHAIALLRVSVALRHSHYDALVDARRGRLKPAFQAKLGWLVANLYGRAATEDWADQKNGGERLSKLIKEQLEDPSCVWEDDEAMRLAKEKGQLPPNLPREQALAAIADHRPKPLNERIADEVVKILLSVAKNRDAPLTLTDSQVTSIRQRAVNSPISRLLRRTPL